MLFEDAAPFEAGFSSFVHDLHRHGVVRDELRIGFPRLHVGEVDLRRPGLHCAVDDDGRAADADHAVRVRVLQVVVLFKLQDALVDLVGLVPAESGGGIGFEREGDGSSIARLCTFAHGDL